MKYYVFLKNKQKILFILFLSFYSVYSYGYSKLTINRTLLIQSKFDVNIETSSCASVTDVVVIKNSKDEILVSWTLLDDTQTDWIIEYGPSGFTPGEGNGIEVTTTSNSNVSVKGIEAGDYDLYVKAGCGNETYSDYSDVATFTTTLFEGEGTEDSPYLISSFEDLYNLSQVNDLWSSNFKLTTDIDASNSKNSETYNDDGSGFSPIGNKSVPFSGVFDGNGHVISDLYINRNTDYIGFFGYVGSGAIIKNLGLENVSMNTTKGYNIASLVGGAFGSGSSKVKISNCYSSGGIIDGANKSGGLFGYSYYSNIKNCYCNDEVRGTYYVGGFIGEADENTTFTNCYSSGKVSGTNNVAAFVGTSFLCNYVDCYFDKEMSTWTVAERGDGTLEGIEGLDIEDFYNESNFTNWDFEEGNGDWKIGALNSDTYLRPRLSWQNIDDDVCLSPINLKVTSVDNSNAVVSWQEMGTANSWIVEFGVKGFSIGDGTQVEVTGETETNISGLSTPEVYDIYVYSSCGSISKVFTFCNFTGGGSGEETDPYKISSIGDLNLLSNSKEVWNKFFIQIKNINASETKTSDTYNNSGYGFSPIGNSNVYFTGSYDGNGYVISNLYINSSSSYAGLFGILEEGATLKNIGIVSPTIQEYNSKKIYNVGSLVGYVEGTEDKLITIENCYSFNGDISGYNYIGGLVGCAYYCEISNCFVINKVSGNAAIGGMFGGVDTYVDISNCYSAGYVDSDGANGGFCGSEYGSSLVFTNCFFDLETANLSYGIDGEDKDGITGLETSDFSNSDSFTDWDFTNTWNISKVFNEDILRPRFQSQIKTLTLSVSGNGTINPVAGIYNFSLGEPITIEAVPDDGYSFINWKRDDVEFSPEETLLLDSLTESTTLCAYFTDIPSGIKEKLSNKISVYPNPAKNYVCIKGEDDLGAIVNIQSITGILIKSQVIDSGTNQIDISRLVAGTYFVVVTKDNKILSKQKLVVF